MDNQLPPLKRRLFYCPGQQRFFWIEYNQASGIYNYGGQRMALAQVEAALNSHVIPERRFWDGPNNTYAMLPFNQARLRAYYNGQWREVDTLRLLHVKESPLPVPLADKRRLNHAEGVKSEAPYGNFAGTRPKRGKKR